MPFLVVKRQVRTPLPRLSFVPSIIDDQEPWIWSLFILEEKQSQFSIISFIPMRRLYRSHSLTESIMDNSFFIVEFYSCSGLYLVPSLLDLYVLKFRSWTFSSTWLSYFRYFKNMDGSQFSNWKIGTSLNWPFASLQDSPNMYCFVSDFLPALQALHNCYGRFKCFGTKKKFKKFKITTPDSRYVSFDMFATILLFSFPLCSLLPLFKILVECGVVEIEEEILSGDWND